jgi:hypothetical protein
VLNKEVKTGEKFKKNIPFQFFLHQRLKKHALMTTGALHYPRSGREAEPQPRDPHPANRGWIRHSGKNTS